MKPIQARVVVLRVTLVTTMLALISCGSSTSDSDSDEVSLVGTWESACLEGQWLSYLDDISYFRSTFTQNSSDEFSEVIKGFDSEDCELDTEIWRETITASLVLGDVVQEGTPPLRSANFVYKTITATVLDKDLAEIFVFANFCGVSDWIADTATDISGQSCNGRQLAEVQTTVYDIAEISGNTVAFGKRTAALPGTSESLRPDTTLSVIYTKQEE